jgi:hypothetical protein
VRDDDADNDDDDDDDNNNNNNNNRNKQTTVNKFYMYSRENMECQNANNRRANCRL